MGNPFGASKAKWSELLRLRRACQGKATCTIECDSPVMAEWLARQAREMTGVVSSVVAYESGRRYYGDCEDDGNDHEGKHCDVCGAMKYAVRYTRTTPYSGGRKGYVSYYKTRKKADAAARELRAPETSNGIYLGTTNVRVEPLTPSTRRG